MPTCRLVPILLLGGSFVLMAGETQKVPTVVAPPPETSSVSDDELLQIKPVIYRPSLNRDPFMAPTDYEGAKHGDLVDDIGVKGYVVEAGKMLAVVSDSRGNIRSLPVGYKFKDGEIFAIDGKAVTFHQWDITSTNRSVYRTVIKPFKREETKR